MTAVDELLAELRTGRTSPSVLRAACIEAGVNYEEAKALRRDTGELLALFQIDLH
jgi:hypothetical protein